MGLQDIDAKKILQASRTGLWRLEFEGGQLVRLYADALSDELFGITSSVSPEERLQIFSSRIHPDDQALFQDYVEKLSETHTEIVYRYIHPESGEMIVRCGGILETVSGDRTSVIGTHQDISDLVRLEKGKVAERRLAEQNLTLKKEQAVQENYYQELLDAQNCGLLVYTLPGHRIVHMNAEALRMYGMRNTHEAQLHLGSLLRSIYYPDPGTAAALHRLRDEDIVVDYECILNQGHENECHIMAKTKTILLLNGERAAMTTFLDVSDMMMLRKALQRAEEGSRAKSAFLFAMSHDLRTPMNAIIGYADLIEAHWDDKAASWGYLRKLKDASRFLLALIGNVLEVSRIESGKETLKEAPWDLRKLSETLDVLLENDIERKHLHITRHLDLPHPYVLCDAMKLREILMNLLSNAVKYTPAGGQISLEVEELPSAEAGQIRCRIRVADTGIGIAEEYIPHLFEAFSRERDSSESGILGTGLGLRIVRSFLDLMGGEIQVTSSLGQGSCFTAEIPLQLASEEALTQSTAALPPDFSLAGRRILLAEDNALNAEITATILSDAQATVETAEDGATALAMLQAAPAGYYDLILMDIQMPHMNGYQAAKAIRALPDPRAKTPIIAMTANAFEEDRKAAFAAGMDAFATKPIELSKLVQVIAATLDKGKNAP